MTNKVKKPIFLSVFLKIGITLLFLVGVYRLGLVIFKNLPNYFTPFYNEAVYKQLENVFNHSQYRQKENPIIIPDETVYSYAAGAYLRGVDPILINSERTPLGKYFISLSILLLKNDKFVVIPFGLFTLASVWLLSTEVLKNKWLAVLPVTLLFFEALFLNQLVVAPLLDIIHLPFILFTLYFFIREERRGNFWLTPVLLGLVMATKTAYSGFLLIVTFLMYLILSKQLNKFKNFLIALPLSFIVFSLSYLRTFQSGYNLSDFIGFQKWILLYDKSKIIFPLSIWRLVFFNQWQAWWGDMHLLKADDWQITWPVFIGLSFLVSLLIIIRRIKTFPALSVLVLWFLVYSLYMSLGIASSRFLLPVLPIAYVLGTYLVKILLKQIYNHKYH